MTHIHYKFSSKLSSNTVIFDGPHITLRELKKLIMGKEKLRSGDCDLQITNAQTKEGNMTCLWSVFFCCCFFITPSFSLCVCFVLSELWKRTRGAGFDSWVTSASPLSAPFGVQSRKVKR